MTPKEGQNRKERIVKWQLSRNGRITHKGSLIEPVQETLGINRKRFKLGTWEQYNTAAISRWQT